MNKCTTALNTLRSGRRWSKPHALLRLCCALLVLLCSAGAALPIWLDQEQAVYRALLEPLVGYQTFAVASTPATCDHAESDERIPPALLAAFKDANGPTAARIDLTALKDIAAIANSRYLNSIEGHRLSRVGPEQWPLVRLSRAGFVGDQAMFCMQGATGEMLAWVERQAGVWTLR